MKTLMNNEVTIDSAPVAFVHKVRINRDIGDPCEYEQFLNLLETASENDCIHLYINTHGGRKDTMIEIISAMRKTKAHLIGEITSNCMSAGTFIFLTCDEFIINEHIEFMAHDASWGTGGKRSDISETVTFKDKVLSSMIETCYEGFFTSDEIERILDGKEYWLEASEVADRLEARSAYFEEKLKDVEYDLEQQQQSTNKGAKELFKQVKTQVDELLTQGMSKKEIKSIIKLAVEPFGVKVNINKKIEDILATIEAELNEQ